MMPSSFSAQTRTRERREARERVQATLLSDASLRTGIERRDAQALHGASLVLGAPREQLVRIARSANRHMLTQLDLWERGLRDELDIDADAAFDRASASGSGAILAAYHFGRYRAIIPTLLARGHKLTILADGVNAQQVDRESDTAYWHQRYASLDRRFVSTVASESPTALWELTRAVRQGRIVVMFVDGNSGMDGFREDASCVRVPFFSRLLVARVGIAALAMASGAPVFPAFARDRGRQCPALEVREPLRTRTGLSKAEGRTALMGDLFALLEQEIRRRPQRWEEWAHLPRWLAPQDRAPAPGGFSVPLASASSSLAVTTPALVGRRLTLARPSVFEIPWAGRPQLVDVAALVPLGNGPLWPELLDAAARRTNVLGWIRAQPSTTAALDALSALLRRGVVAMEAIARSGGASMHARAVREVDL